MGGRTTSRCTVHIQLQLRAVIDTDDMMPDPGSYSRPTTIGIGGFIIGSVIIDAKIQPIDAKVRISNINGHQIVIARHQSLKRIHGIIGIGIHPKLHRDAPGHIERSRLGNGHKLAGTTECKS